MGNSLENEGDSTLWKWGMFKVWKSDVWKVEHKILFLKQH